MDFSKAKVGDRVYDLYEGWARISEIGLSGMWLTPDGDPNVRASRRIDGKNYDGYQMTYWSKPTITGGDEPPQAQTENHKKLLFDESHQSGWVR